MRFASKGSGADEARDRLIVTWWAHGHDALDRHGIPRRADGLEYTIAERIDLLAARDEPPPSGVQETTGGPEA